MKRTLKVTDAVYYQGRLIATLVENDQERGWAAGQNIKTSLVINIEGNNYETRNTIYVVEGNTLIPSKMDQK